MTKPKPWEPVSYRVDDWKSDRWESFPCWVAEACRQVRTLGERALHVRLANGQLVIVRPRALHAADGGDGDA